MNKLSNDVGTYDDGHDAGPVDGFIDVIVSLFGHRRGGGRIRFGALHGERTERLRDPGGVERGEWRLPCLVCLRLEMNLKPVKIRRVCVESIWVV